MNEPGRSARHHSFGRHSQPSDRGSRMPFPAIFEMCVAADVGYQRGPKARDALTAGFPNAPIHHTIRARVQQLACEVLGSVVAHGIVQREMLGYICAYIMKSSIEIRQVKPHLEPRFEHTNFRQLCCSVVNSLRVRRIERCPCVPRASVWSIEPAAANARMTKRGHNHACHRFSNHPFARRNSVQDPQFGRDAVVRPAFQLED